MSSLSGAGNQALTSLESEEIFQAFRDFMLDVIPLVDRGRVARDQWKSRSGYVAWFYHDDPLSGGF